MIKKMNYREKPGSFRTIQAKPGTDYLRRGILLEKCHEPKKTARRLD